MIETVILPSLTKVFPDSTFNRHNTPNFTALQNEPYSFQLAYKLKDKSSPLVPFYIRVKTDLPISIYSVGYVQILGSNSTDYPEDRGPGLYPDMLLPKSVNPDIKICGKTSHNKNRLYFEDNERYYLKASASSYKSLWLTVNENRKTIPAGEYPITISFYARIENAFLGEVTTTIKIINTKLPPQKTFYTNWFHCDCLADYYNVDIFSDRFFEIFENYVKVAVQNGMNTILLPAFTPALDTPFGLERKTAQLVGVTLNKGQYSFDFSLMKKYTDICKKAGIKYFEHCHLFSQWGAKYCPKIVAFDGKKTKCIFGWKTQSTDIKYTEFLRQYLTELSVFLKKEKLDKKIIFHFSDEPLESDLNIYRKVKDSVKNLLKGYMQGDALSDYSFYEQGIVQTPIVSTHKINDFIGKCDNMWCYYTGGKYGKLSNRLILNSSERNRFLGVQMYYNNIKGFLHWGYNFYYDSMSNGFFDPKTNPEGYGKFPGASYLVYPSNDGTAIQSIRMKVFYEGINDIRALQLLEKLYSRDFVIKTIEKHFGKVTFETEAESYEKLLSFRNEINNLIESKR